MIDREACLRESVAPSTRIRIRNFFFVNSASVISYPNFLNLLSRARVNEYLQIQKCPDTCGRRLNKVKTLRCFP